MSQRESWIKNDNSRKYTEEMTGKLSSTTPFEQKILKWISRKLMNFVPEPLVWSAEGPVLLLGVGPDPSSHWKLALRDGSLVQWQNPSKSKSQSSAPVAKTIHLFMNMFVELGDPRYFSSRAHKLPTVILRNGNQNLSCESFSCVSQAYGEKRYSVISLGC